MKNFSVRWGMKRPKFFTQQPLLPCINEHDGGFSAGSNDEYQPNEGEED